MWLLLSFVSDCTLNGVRAEGGSIRAIALGSCFNMRLDNCEGICAAEAVSQQYGLAFIESQNVVVDGGYFFGTRHGITMGNSNAMPTRHCIVQNAEIANQGTRSGAADFHGSVADSAYISCRIQGTCHLGGTNNRFEHCHITANRSDLAMAYNDINSGTNGYYNCILTLSSDFSNSEVIGDISTSTSRLQDQNAVLQYINNVIECNSGMSRIATHTIAMDGLVDLSIVHRGNILTGDTSGLLRYFRYFLDTTNPGGFPNTPTAPQYIEVRNNRPLDQAATAFPQLEVVGGNLTGTELNIDTRSGTWTPTITTDGTDFDSVTYAVQSGDWRRVDDLVFVEATLMTSAVTIGSASGNVVVGGLPFTNGASSNQGGFTIGNAFSWATNGNPLMIGPNAGATTARLLQRSAVDGDNVTLAASDVATGANSNVLRFSGWYITSDNF